MKLWFTTQVAHVSLILGKDKLRQKAWATSVSQYRQKGYLPEALVNFLALLGWNPEGEEEIFTLDEIIERFSLERVAKNPAVFDLDKLNYINQQYIKQKTISELKEALRPFIEASPYADRVQELGEDKYGWLVEGIRDYLVCLADVKENLSIFFDDPDYTQEAIEVLRQEGVGQVLDACQDRLPESFTQFDRKFLKTLVKETRLRLKWCICLCAFTGRTRGLELPYLMSVWGPDECRRRLELARQQLPGQESGWGQRTVVD